jgi:hypothetical protein
MKPSLTAEKARELLEYSQETGLFTWKQRVGNVAAGSVAGALSNRGYTQIKVGGAAHSAHRLAWLWMTGEWPVLSIDHINGVRTDNRWRNLRLADPYQQGYNQGNRKSNTVGLKGVSLNKRLNKFQVQVRHGGKRTYVGIFDTPEQAHSAYCEAIVDLHGEFARND